MPTFRASRTGHLSGKAGRSAGGLVLVLALVAGLLNFPSTCVCGTETPHAHSLFLLADHHHHHDGEIDYAEGARGHGHAPGKPGSVSPSLTEVAQPGAVVHGPVSEVVAGDQVGLSLAWLAIPDWAGLRTVNGWGLLPPIPTNAEPPDPPPPRVERFIV